MVSGYTQHYSRHINVTKSRPNHSLALVNSHGEIHASSSSSDCRHLFMIFALAECNHDDSAKRHNRTRPLVIQRNLELTFVKMMTCHFADSCSVLDFTEATSSPCAIMQGPNDGATFCIKILTLPVFCPGFQKGRCHLKTAHLAR